VRVKSIVVEICILRPFVHTGKSSATKLAAIACKRNIKDSVYCIHLVYIYLQFRVAKKTNLYRNGAIVPSEMQHNSLIYNGCLNDVRRSERVLSYYVTCSVLQKLIHIFFGQFA